MTFRLLLRPEAAPSLRLLLATRSNPFVLAVSRLLATGQYLPLRIYDRRLILLVLACRSPSPASGAPYKASRYECDCIPRWYIWQLP